MAIGADLAPAAARGEFLGVFRSVSVYVGLQIPQDMCCGDRSLTNSGALFGPGLTGALVGVSVSTASVALGSIALVGGLWCLFTVRETLVKEDNSFADKSGVDKQDVIFAPLPEVVDSGAAAGTGVDLEDLDSVEAVEQRMLADKIYADCDTDCAIMSPTSSIVT